VFEQLYLKISKNITKFYKHHIRFLPLCQQKKNKLKFKGVNICRWLFHLHISTKKYTQKYWLQEAL